jgi:hypothetical protein
MSVDAENQRSRGEIKGRTGSSGEEKGSSSSLVNNEDTRDSHDDVDDVGDDSDDEGVVDAGPLEERGSVVEDEVDTGDCEWQKIEVSWTVRRIQENERTNVAAWPGDPFR